MNPVKTLIMAVVLAAVAAFIFFYEMPKAEKEKQEKQELQQIMQLDWDALDRIELSGDGPQMILEKKDDRWFLKKPVEDVADEGPVATLINAVRFGEVERRLTEFAKPLENYGLANPKQTLSYRADGVIKTLEIGNKYSIEGSLFVKNQESPEVLIVSDSLIDTLAKPYDDYRDPTAFRFARPPLISIKIEKRNEETLEIVKLPTEFEREDGESWEWKIFQPFESFGDENAVEALVGDARRLIADRFVTSADVTDPKFGLVDPLLRITLGYTEGAPTSNSPEVKTETIAIGSLAKDTEFYWAALDEGRTMITLPSGGVKFLLVDPITLRDRKVLRFDANRVSKIRLQIAGGSAMITHSGSGWTFADGSLASAVKCKQILDNLSTMKGTLLDPKQNQVDDIALSDSIELLDENNAGLAKAVRGPEDAKLGSVKIVNATAQHMLIFDLAVEELDFWPTSIDGLRSLVKTKELPETGAEDKPW